jgi:hypothetical protein
MSHKTANKESWRKFIRLYRSVSVPVFGVFLPGVRKNNVQTGSFENILVMTFAKRLELAQNYRVVYGQSLLLQHAVAQVCLTVYGALYLQKNI